MGSYDLTKLLMRYFDRHQCLPFLEFLEEKKSYNLNDLRKAKYELVASTKMFDLAIAEYTALHQTEEVPADLEAGRTSVYTVLEEKSAACGPFAELMDKLEKEDGSEEIYKTLQTRNSGIEFTEEHVDALYPYAKYSYDCGRYASAAIALRLYRQLIKDEEKKFSALWGKLAAEMLFQNFTAAATDLRELREEISRRELRKATSHLDLLQQRTWLIHWGLAIFCKKETDLADGPNLLIEYLFNEFYVIQTNCSHVLRYLVAMVIVNKSRKTALKDTIKLLSTEEKYSDPITKFLLCIGRDYDFGLTQSLLKECVEVVSNDIFLHSYLDQFLDGARLLVFEYYCRIHKCIEIDTLGSVLYGEEKMSEEETENRIVDLIRVVGLNAHVDSEQRQINMVQKQQSRQNVYDQVIERIKLKNIDNRTRTLIQQISKDDRDND